MPIDICGFVEVSNMGDADLDEEHSWMTCLDLTSLPLNTGEVCTLLFGVSKSSFGVEGYENTREIIAHRRGLPASMGYATAQEAKEALDAAESDVVRYWGFTYITYKELQQIDWYARLGANLQELGEYGWDTLFKLMDVLSERFAHQRLVVWFYW